MKWTIAATLLAVSMAGAAQAQKPVAKVNLQLDPTGANTLRLGYMPIRLTLAETCPAGVTKQPAYAGKPRYAVVNVGNGPKAAHVVAVDEPEGGEFKVWFDANGDGDLTNDGDGAWAKKQDQGNGRVLYGVNNFDVRGSWGSPNKESSTGTYGIAMYRIVSSSVNALLMYRTAARTGTLTLGDTEYKAALVENDADGIYTKSLGDDNKPLPGQSASPRPVWLILESNGKRIAPIDVRYPFEVGGKTYVAQASGDGSVLQLLPTTREAKKAPVAPERPPILANGKDAPDFTVTTPDGRPVKLSDFRGKTVILDFWATWCGPCKASMPHLEEIWKKVQNKDVVVMAVCVWDDKAEFDKWVPQNRDKYTFPVSFDAAGRDSAKSIAGKLFGVSGIPTTFVIGKDGKVVEGLVGFSGANDKRLEAALGKAGVSVD